MTFPLPVPYLVAGGQGAAALVPGDGDVPRSCHHAVEVQGLSLGDRGGRGLDADRWRGPCGERGRLQLWQAPRVSQKPSPNPSGVPRAASLTLTWHHHHLDAGAGCAGGAGAHAEVDATISHRDGGDEQRGDVRALRAGLRRGEGVSGTQSPHGAMG